MLIVHSLSLITRPHPEDLDGLLFIEDLVDQPVLYVDASRDGSFEITQETLERRR